MQLRTGTLPYLRYSKYGRYAGTVTVLLVRDLLVGTVTIVLNNRYGTVPTTVQAVSDLFLATFFSLLQDEDESQLFEEFISLVVDKAAGWYRTLPIS